MQSQETKVYAYVDKDVTEDDSVQGNSSMYRYAFSAYFDRNARAVVFEKRRSRRYLKSDLEKGKRIPTAKDIMKYGSKCKSDPLYKIPFPLVDISTLRCDCRFFRSCIIKISNRSKIKNREQAVCKAMKCKYRQWFDTAHIQCICGVPADLSRSKGEKIPENKGKEYFRCGYWKRKRLTGTKCQFFCWKSDLELEGYLGMNWGTSHMSLEDALKGILEIYKLNSHKGHFSCAEMSIPYEIRSTLAGKCK